MANSKYKLGFIGQGWIGKNYADHFENRGFEIVRYGLQPEYINNREKIKSCDFVFIAVPAPTTIDGFDDKNIIDAIELVGVGKVAIIKSTIIGGTTRKIQDMYPERVIFHVPEFLREAHARYDVDFPTKIFIGVSDMKNTEHVSMANSLLEIMPESPYRKILPAEEAEFLKYTHNTMGYATILFTNILYDLAQSYGVRWEVVKEAILNNPWFPEKYIEPIHAGGRGAGGDCFIKDFAALAQAYNQRLGDDSHGVALLDAMIKKNNKLLRDSGKSVTILEGVHGDTAGFE